MSYYQRPMGDYKTYGYAGDPGLFSFLGKIAKKAIKYLAPVFGGPLGVAAGALAGYAGGAAQPPQVGLGPQAWMPGAGARGPSMPGFRYPSTGAISAVPGEPGFLPPRGYHLAKDGSGRYVRNRRMNVANPRALRRSMRRVQGFEKLAKRTISFTRRVKMKK